jgi:hypothetical protein
MTIALSIRFPGCFRSFFAKDTDMIVDSCTKVARQHNEAQTSPRDPPCNTRSWCRIVNEVNDINVFICFVIYGTVRMIEWERGDVA